MRLQMWVAVVGVLAAGAAGSFATPALAAAPPPSPAPTPGNLAADKGQIAEEQFQRRMEQSQIASRVRVNDQIPPGQRVLVDYGAYLTFNYLSADDPTHDNHILRETDLVAYGRVNLDNVQEVFARGRVSYRDFNTDDAFGGIDSTGQHSVLEQLYYRFDLQRYLAAYDGVTSDNDVAIQGGRQTVIWGNGLTFNQDVDGFVFDALKGPVSVEAVAGVTARETIDFDTSRPTFNLHTRRGFYGVLLSAQVDRHKPYVYFLGERDYNKNDPLVVNVAGQSITTRFNYNSFYIGAGSNGSIGDRLVYGFEGTFEGGNGLSNSFTRTSGGITPVRQRHDNIRAFAADGRLDYVFADSHNSRASAELILASGDHDRGAANNTFNGNKPGTNDLAFNGFGLLNTGLAFAPQVSNVAITRFGVSTDPLNNFALFRKLEIGGDFFVFDKFLERAPIDEPTASGRYLGCEPDVFLNWQITSDLTLAMRYGCFFPGDKILSSNRNRQLFFTGVTLAF